MTPYPPYSVNPASIDPLWILDLQELKGRAESVAYPPETIAVLLAAARELAGAPSMQQSFLEFHRKWLSGERIVLPEPRLSPWHALAVVACFPAIVEMHKERQIPWEITVATLSDLPRRMKNFIQTHGYPGFDAHLWMRNHIQGRLFQVGRLQYVFGQCFYPANVYDDGSCPVALARADIACDSEGWPYPPNRESEASAEGDWSTALGTTRGRVIGHEVRPDGSISRAVREISDTSPVLHAESDVLHIHIPMGDKLLVKACLDSISAAFPFFEKYFPERNWAGVCCGSWLLDHAFDDFLPPSSNIVGFGRLFSTLPWPGVDHQSHLRWVFGPDIDIDAARSMPNKNSLQQAIIDYLDGGGTLRARAGYILRHQLPALFQKLPAS